MREHNKYSAGFEANVRFSIGKTRGTHLIESETFDEMIEELETLYKSLSVEVEIDEID